MSEETTTGFGSTQTGGAAGSARWSAAFGGDDAPTAAVGGVVVGDDDETSTSAGTGDGETVAAETQVAPQEVMEELRRSLERRSKGRRFGLFFALAVFAAGLVALWFVSRPDNEADKMIYPLNAAGQPDAETWILRDEGGRALVEVDYPRNARLEKSEFPGGKGLSVVSFMGRDRDVPFFLQIEAVPSEEELSTDLLSSARAWIDRSAESGAFVFDDRVKEGLEPKFFEDAYEGSCQSQSLYGVRFVQFEYKRTWPDGGVWHGVAIYFRRGDTAYVHRRELPEFYWARGGYRLIADPNLAVYSNFIDSYWESPGAGAMPKGRSPADLLAEVRTALARERASDWRFVKGDIDALLAASWRSDRRVREAAEGCLRQFREVLKVYYWQKYNAYRNAMDNRQEKRALRFRQDAEMVFDNRDERYYYLIGNGEVW